MFKVMLKAILFAAWRRASRQIPRATSPLFCPVRLGEVEEHLGDRLMGRNNYTNLLYAQPTLLSGFASVLDLGGRFARYNTSPTESEADIIAMTADWYAVFGDLDRAIETFDPGRGTGEAGPIHGR